MEKPNLNERKIDADLEAARMFVGFKLDMILEKADKQLNLIEPALQDLMTQIEREKPDVLFFMDKGARVFALPIHKYLNQTTRQAPQIRFTNDKAFKIEYLHNQLTPEDIFKKYGAIKNKKVFFIDETFSSGFGAAVIIKIKEALGNEDIYYFALSKDVPKKPRDEVASDWHQNNLAEIRRDKKFVIYPNAVTTLFSKDLGELYVSEEQLEEGEVITKPKKWKIEVANDSSEVESGLPRLDLGKESIGISDVALDAAYQKLMPKALAIIHKMIYERLAGSEEFK